MISGLRLLRYGVPERRRSDASYTTSEEVRRKSGSVLRGGNPSRVAILARKEYHLQVRLGFGADLVGLGSI